MADESTAGGTVRNPESTGITQQFALAHPIVAR
jgi:hypothetical protein